MGTRFTLLYVAIALCESKCNAAYWIDWPLSAGLAKNKAVLCIKNNVLEQMLAPELPCTELG